MSSVKEDLVGSVETAATETEDANEDLLAVAEANGVELSGVNLKKDGNDLFRLMGIERNFPKKTQLRELVDTATATVTTGVKLTTRLEPFVEQARTAPVVELAGVDLETDEDDLFAHFRIDKGDVASKSQLRYLVKRAKLLAQQQRSEVSAQQQQNGKKKARICFSFDASLPEPYDVIPPKSTTPEFVAPDDWLQEVEDEIVAQMVR
ncbi:MAG: hypothetical protein SGARI_005785, partial [Bacillariaceae sp.]